MLTKFMYRLSYLYWYVHILSLSPHIFDILAAVLESRCFLIKLLYGMGYLLLRQQKEIISAN